MSDRFCVEFYDGDKLLGAVEFPLKRGKASDVAKLICDAWRLPFVTAVYYKLDGTEATRKQLPARAKENTDEESQH